MLQDPFNVITYAIIGDDLAPHYFKINKDDGNITITTDIKNDVVTDYQVRSTLVLYFSHSLDHSLIVERGSSVGRMPDSQSREPGFESPLLPFRSLGIFFHFTTPQPTQLYK